MEDNREGTIKTDRKSKFKSKYARIGLTAFIVVACCIVFYFSLFESHTLFEFLKKMASNVKPFVVGGILAYLLKPICGTFENWLNKAFSRMKNKYRAERLKNNLAIFLTMVFFLIFLYVLFWAVIPQVIDSLKVLFNAIPETFDNVMNWLMNLAKDNEALRKPIEQLTTDGNETITKWMTKYADVSADKVFDKLKIGLSGIWGFLKNALIGIIACVYILAQRRKLGAQGKLIINSIFSEKWSEKVMEEIHYIDRMFSGFINGKIIDSLIIGIITFIVTSIFKIPYAILISVIVGVTNIIPFFGPYIGAIPSAFVVLMVSPVKCLYFIIIIIIIQQFDGNFLGPKILGNTTGLSSFWILFSLIFFGGLFGFMGMLLGVPLFAVLYDIVRKLVIFGLDKRKKKSMYDDYENAKNVEQKLKEQNNITPATGIEKIRKKMKKDK